MVREKVNFETNVWHELALRWTDGVDGKNAIGEYVRFTTSDDDTLFATPTLAQKIRGLGLKSMEKFRVRKAELKVQGSKPRVEWQVARLTDPPAEAAPEAATRIRERIARETPKAPLSGEAAKLRDAANMLVDVLAECRRHAQQHKDISAEDVRACLLSAYSTKEVK